MGTEEYLPPEIVAGTGHAAAADWWSFGILIYELMYGFTPFRGARRDDTFENILKRQLVFPEVRQGGGSMPRGLACQVAADRALLVAEGPHGREPMDASPTHRIRVRRPLSPVLCALLSGWFLVVRPCPGRGSSLL